MRYIKQNGKEWDTNEEEDSKNESEKESEETAQ